MFDGLQNPALAFGALAALVPLIIHLLNQRRHRPLAFGAMRFVLAAYRRTRRRAQMENLLLLLLRMGAVALLAFALARPFSGGDSPLTLLTESRRDVLLVIDASASTGYREHVESVFERIVARARERVADLDGSRGDRVRVLLADSAPRLIAWRTPDEATSALATLAEPSDGPMDLAATLAEVRRIAAVEMAGDGAALEIVLLTDLQRGAFFRDAGAAQPADAASGAAGDAQNGAADASASDWRGELDALAAMEARVRVEDLGAPEPTPPNLGVLAVTPTEPVLGPSLPVEVEVLVANHGTVSSLVRVSLAVDGERLPTRSVEVPARGTARALFPTQFERPGPHVLEASLEGDRLTFDDRRADVLWVPAPVRVLAVNGAPVSDDIEKDALGLVLAALEPFQSDDSLLNAFTPFQIRAANPFELADEDLDLGDFDVILVAGVESLTSPAVARLEERVRQGAGLVLAPGEATVPEAWNEALFRADGTGLLPAEMDRRVSVSSRRESYFRVARFDETHPALEFFAEPRWRPLLTEVPFYDFVAVRPLPDALVLAALDDEPGSPLLLERAFGSGRVLLFTSSLNPDWNRLSLSARTLVPFAHELLRHAARMDPPRRTLALGEALLPRFDAFPRNPVLVAPGGERRALGGDPREVEGGFELDPVLGADRAGLWRVESDNGERVNFAIAPDPAEGDLERLSGAELSSLHPALVPVAQDRDRSGRAEPSGSRGELWRPIALLALLALVGDSLFAAFLGRRRSHG